MATSGIGLTYDFGAFDASSVIREDLRDAIANIDPYDTPLYTIVGKVDAASVYHNWPEDTLAATATGGGFEGTDFSEANLEVPTRGTNVCQIFRKDIKLSGSDMAATHAGIPDMYRYQVMKALREIKRNKESRTFSGSGGSATGAGTATARVMKSLADFITTHDYHVAATAIDGNGTAVATGVTEAAFNGLLEVMYNSGSDAHDVFCSPNAKRQVSAFSLNASHDRVIAATDRTLIMPVDVYDSDTVGRVFIHVDRWIPQSTATASAEGALNGSLYVLDRTRINYAFYRPTRHLPLPPGGDNVRGIALEECTIELMNEKGHGRLWGMKKIAAPGS
jgi:hypothetical protein